MDYVRLVVDISHAVEEGSSLFLMRRDHGSLVPYIRSLVLALPGNHTMQLASEASRWRRKLELWKMAKATPGGTMVSSSSWFATVLYDKISLKMMFVHTVVLCSWKLIVASKNSVASRLYFTATQAQEPKLPDPILGAALQSEYTSKYTTKADATKINQKFLWSAYFAQKKTRTSKQVRNIKSSNEGNGDHFR